MENIIELPNQQPIKQMRVTIIMVSTIVIVGLIIGIWNLLTGGIGFYPNVTLFHGKLCGGYQAFVHPITQFNFTHCFSTADDEEKIDDWYRTRGWFRIGERLLYPDINLGLVRLMVAKEFLTERQPDGKILLVHSVKYFFFEPNSPALSTP